MKLPANPFTVTGRMLGIATTATLLAVVDSSLAPLLSQLLWLVILAFICGLLFRPRLTLRLCTTPLLINGQRFQVAMILENTGRLAAYDLTCEFPSSLRGLELITRSVAVEALAAGAQTIIHFEIQATARGEFALPSLQIASLFPLGMFRFISHHAIAERLAVAPRYQHELHSEWMRHFGDASAIPQLLQREKALEYIGSREYREGMSVRRWDYAAWARLGSPAVREFDEAEEPTLVIVVDVLHRSKADVDEALEALLCKVAAVVVALDQHRFRLVLIQVAESVVLSDHQGGNAQAESLLRELARVVGAVHQAPWPDAWAAAAEITRGNAPVACFLRSDRQDFSRILPAVGEMPALIVEWTPTLPARAQGHATSGNLPSELEVTL